MISFPTAAGQSAAPVKARPLVLHDDKRVVVPVAVVLIGLLALLLLVLAPVSSRRRAR